MINKIKFSARNLTSNAGLLLLLEHTSKNGIFDLIDHDPVFENAFTNKIKMKTVLKLREFCQNYHSFVVKLLAKFIRCGISVSLSLISHVPRRPELAANFLLEFTH